MAVDDATGEAVLGEIVPRIFTAPLVQGPPGPCGCGCALTPETSDGFEFVDFATLVLGVPPDPWQRWLAIHAMELLPDRRPRFRRVLVLVARQNGKTYLLGALACYWMYLCGPMRLLGSSTKTGMAVKAWQQAIKFAKAVPELAAEIPTGRGRGIKTGSGQESWTLTNGSRYEPVASNEDGGRGDSLDRVIADELRKHKDYSAYGASYHAMRARPYAQFWGISSMGDGRSQVLNDLRGAALTFIESGNGDPRLGIFEWSPPADADPLDPRALAMANPNVGRRFPMEDLLADALVAVGKGGQALTDFKTEAMNIKVSALDPAVDPVGWAECEVPGDLDGLRGGLVAAVDVAPSLRHVTLLAGAQMPDGRVRVEPVQAWDGENAVTKAEADLPGWLARNRPRKFGYLPGGPAAAMVATLRERKGRTSWPPPGVTVEEISGEVTAACMLFAAAVAGRQVVHSGDPLLNAHVLGARKLMRGDVWRFDRLLKDGDDAHVDAAYAAAAVVLLARTLPTPMGKPRIILPKTGRG